MRKMIGPALLALVISGCSGSNSVTGPSPVASPPSSSPVAGSPQPTFAARPVCTSSRLLKADTETRTYTIVGPARDGTRSNPFEMSYGSTKAYGVWAVDVEWQLTDAPLTLRILKQDSSRSANPVTPVEAKTARTGLTTWSACWEGSEDDRMSVEVGFPSGTSQDVRLTWTYPSPRNAPR